MSTLLECLWANTAKTHLLKTFLTIIKFYIYFSNVPHSCFFQDTETNSETIQAEMIWLLKSFHEQFKQVYILCLHKLYGTQCRPDYFVDNWETLHPTYEPQNVDTENICKLWTDIWFPITFSSGNNSNYKPFMVQFRERLQSWFITGK